MTVDSIIAREITGALIGVSFIGSLRAFLESSSKSDFSTKLWSDYIDRHRDDLREIERWLQAFGFTAEEARDVVFSEEPWATPLSFSIDDFSAVIATYSLTPEAEPAEGNRAVKEVREGLASLEFRSWLTNAAMHQLSAILNGAASAAYLGNLDLDTKAAERMMLRAGSLAGLESVKLSAVIDTWGRSYTRVLARGPAPFRAWLASNQMLRRG